MRTLRLAGCCAIALLLLGCSQSPSKSAAKTAELEKPAEPVTGLRALYQMYTAARGWAADAQPLTMNSINLPEVKPEPGKAAAWQVTFVSPAGSKARSYTYSVIEAQGNLHKGVFAGPDQGWSGPRGNQKPFLMAAARKDSDTAYEVAIKKGAEYVKKNPDKPISYLLELTNRFPNPAWRVVWGESVGTSNFSVFVDASTGLYLETMR